jgi:hypothetical protein
MSGPLRHKHACFCHSHAESSAYAFWDPDWQRHRTILWGFVRRWALKRCAWSTPIGLAAARPWGGKGVLVEGKWKQIRVEERRTEACAQMKPKQFYYEISGKWKDHQGDVICKGIIVIITPNRKMTVSTRITSKDSQWTRIHKYIHTSHNNSVLNIKLLQFKVSNSIHQSSCSGIINDKQKLILSMKHGRHYALRRRPRQQSTPMLPPNTEHNHQESEPPTGSRSRHHRKGQRSYLYTII